MAAENVSVCKEQTIIESYFVELSYFNYEKAKDLVEKERDVTKVAVSHSTVTNAIWQSFALSLSTLATLEKSYTSLTFLTPKRFLRAENSLKSQYENVRTDLQCMGSSCTPNGSLSGTPTSGKNSFPMAQSSGVTDDLDQYSHLENLLLHLGGQLCHFVSARLEIIDFYEKLYVASLTRFMKFDELLCGIREISRNSQKKFHHPLLVHVKSGFSLETEILCLLIDSQIKMAQWNFFTSLINLYEAHCKLSTWATRFNQKEAKKLSFLKTPSFPPLYHWLMKLKGSLISKFTFYFHDILMKQSTQEMKNMCSKAPVDYHQRIVSFQKKYDALSICLVFDSRYNDKYCSNSGYNHPHRTFEPPKGLESYPAVMSFPNKPTGHWPNVLMIMSNRVDELNKSDRVVCFYDKRTLATYFLSRIEPGMTLVIIFDHEKSDRDTNITSIVQELTIQLRGNKIFSILKPGTK